MQTSCNNIYHKYLNLPFEIKKHPDFNDTPSDMKHYDINDYVDQAMHTFITDLGLILKHTEIFYTPPGGSLPIHADETYIDNHVKINMTWGPEEGTTRWWKSKYTVVNDYQEDAKQVLENYNEDTVNNFSYREHNVLVSNEKDCELVYEANTNKPSLVNVGQLHSTYNPTNQGRWTICFVPKTEKQDYIYWDEALEIFKDYIVGD